MAFDSLRPDRVHAVVAAWLVFAAASMAAVAAADVAVADVPRALAQRFASWKADIRRKAIGAGIRAETVDRELASLDIDLDAPDLVLPHRDKGKPPAVKGQAEFTRPPQAYLNPKQLGRLADQGRALARQHRATLAAIESKLGVPPAVVLAIWGRETAFGSYRLPKNAIDALATQSFLGRRPELFTDELLFALRMIDEGHATRAKLRSSWAGAVGLTQFMPSEFFSTAFDLDGDGHKDIWSVPDALASAANQLKLKGWQSDRPWGFEVTLPDAVDCAMAGPQGSRTLAEWARLGVAPVDGRRFTATEGTWQAYLLVPGGTYGPVFLVTENYVVFRRYNMSDLYALFVGDLANRIAGRGTFATPWSDLEQIREDELAAIQKHLQTRGYAIDKIDGKLGSNTRSQIGLYQRTSGKRPDCWPTRGLLGVLAGQADRP